MRTREFGWIVSTRPVLSSFSACARVGYADSIPEMAAKKRVERAAWVLVALLALAWAIERFLGESTAIGVLLSLAPRGLYMGLAFALILSAFMGRSWRAAGIGVGALLFSMGPLGGIEMSSSAPKTDAKVFRVVQYNVNKWEAGADVIATSLEAMAPDVACLEEAGQYRWLYDENQRPSG